MKIIGRTLLTGAWRCAAAFIFALGLIGSLADQSYAQAAFFADVEDLPLMPGLREVVEEGMIFDKPEGRIVEVAAAGKATPRQIVAFYDAVLPQLGWKRLADATFTRSGETLRYRTETAGGEATVRISIAPD